MDDTSANFWIVLIIPVATLGINTIIELSAVFAAEFRRPFDESKNLKQGVRAIFWIQYVNLGVLMYFISAPSYYLEFFSEEHEPTYATLGTGWYMYTGGMIAKNLVIEMFAPHITPLLFIIFYKGRLLYDRGCTCNKKRSK